MRRSVVGAAACFILGSLLFAQACGKDPDTPTPSRKEYPKDEIDQVQTTQRLVLPALKEPVRVIRDKRGMVHIYARNIHDAALAEGYMMARDRAPQIELLRRVAEGRLAEALGGLQPNLQVRDITLRAMGLRRHADQAYAQMKDGSDAKEILIGFSAGVSQFYKEMREGVAKQIPNGWKALPNKYFTDWEPQSTLAIGRLQTWALSYTGDDELEFTELLQKVHDTFKPEATDPALKARAGFAVDALRFEPVAKKPVLDTPVPAADTTKSFKPGAIKTITMPPRLSPELLASVRPAIEAMKATRDMLGKGGWSSNNWVVGPSKSATGLAMVASDPHLGLPAPSVFYMAGLHVISDDPSKQLDVAGMSFAGIPGAVLGFNKNIAWGATVAVFDVNDAYRDVIKDNKVTVGGKSVDVKKIVEKFETGKGSVDITLEEIEGHGMVLPTFNGDNWVPRKTDEAITMRWTGMSPPGEFEAFMAVSKAKNVDEAIAAMGPFQVGAQNFVFGDTEGHIRYTTHSHVPIRPKEAFAWDPKTAKGQLPCLVLPGDKGLEWSGKVADNQLPGAKDPAAGYIATANSDQYGLVFDNDPTNDPIYLSCLWDFGLREQRIRQLIDAKDKLTVEDMSRIQSDAKSPLGARITPHLVATLEKAETARREMKPSPELDAIFKDPRYVEARIKFVLSVLQSWKDKSDFDTPAAFPVKNDPLPNADEIAASQATLIFNATMVALHNRVLDDEWTAMGKPPWMRDLRQKTLLRLLEKPEKLATDDGSGESILWDDLTTKDVVETKDQQIILSLLDALDWIVKTYGDNPDKWRWGAAHAIRFTSLLPGTENQLSIPDEGSGYPALGFPRHGDEAVIDRSDPGIGGPNGSFKFTYGSGPAQRFVAVMKAGALDIRNALPGGNVWRPGDAWFDNEADLWRKNQQKKVVFTPSEVVPEAAERWDLEPF
jgi:penicillin G amidase